MRHVGRIDAVVLALVVLAVLAASLHKIVAYDVWWQVAAGHWIVEHGWPQIDPFSYGFPDRQWIELRWIWCLALDAATERMGPNGIIAVRLVCVSGAFAMLWWSCRQAPAWAQALGLATAGFAAHLRLTDRPEIASFLFLAAVLVAIERYRQTGRPTWLIALPVIQVLWVNTHTVFGIGPVLTGIYAGAEFAAGFAPWSVIRDRAMPRRNAVLLGGVAIAMVLACVVNPWGVRGPAFALQLFGQLQSGNAVADIITEIRSPLASPGFTVAFARLPVVVGVSFTVLVLSFRRLQYGVVAIWAAFLYLAVLSDRNLALFGFVSGYAVATHIAGWERNPAAPAERRFAWASRFACAALAVVAIPAFATNAYYVRIDPARRFGLGVADLRYPVRALAFIDQHAIPGRILCNFADGNLILRERGEKSVYVDGRLEVYPPEALRGVEAMFRTGDGLDDAVRRFDIGAVVLAHATDIGLFRIVNRSSAWIPVYFDDAHSVFVRSDVAARAAVAPPRIDWSSPQAPDVELPARYRAADPFAGLWPRVADDAAPCNLGTLGVVVGNLAFAREQFEEAYRRRPDPVTALQLGVACRALGDDDRAAAVLATAGVDGALVGTALAAGGAYEAAGSLEAAAATYQGLADRGSAGPEALTRLARVRLALGQRAEAASAAGRALAIDPDNAAAKQLAAAAAP